MDDMEQNPETNETPAGPEEELSHSDKMIGIFAEPSSTFEKIAKFPVKTIDWLLPLLILLVVVAITQILVMSNEEIAYQVKQKQEKAINELVDKKVLTREQADQRIEQSEKFSNSPLAKVFQTIAIFLFGFIFFFIVSLIYFLFAKFAFKGDGGYTSVLVANGLTFYIAIIQIVIAAILSMAFGRLLNGLSIASLADIDKSTFIGFILGKIDPFSIWAYSIVSIGLAKMFRSSSTIKYFLMVFGVWILGSLLLWGIGKAVPLLSFLSSM
jgi:Yip1 domain